MIFSYFLHAILSYNIQYKGSNARGMPLDKTLIVAIRIYICPNIGGLEIFNYGGYHWWEKSE